MPTLVQFGAGNIGRGFIAPTFSTAGWRVIFVDVNPAMLSALQSRGSYRVMTVTGDQEQITVMSNVSAIDGRDTAAVAAAIATADLAATAVGLGALKHLGAPLALGLAQRTKPLDILVCENGAEAHTVLKTAVAAHTTIAFGAVRTSIGRMIPAPGPDADVLDVRVEPYAHLPVERKAFLGPVPVVPNLEPADDFDLVLRQKLYLHNLTHAALAYAGHQRGCATIPDCMEHPELVALARRCGREAAAALALAHGSDASSQATIRAACLTKLDDLLHRYRNRALNDPVARVARDPWRKLAADDRLVGAARLCLDQGIDPVGIGTAILAACAYHPAADEPEAARFLALRALGPEAVLAAAANLQPGDPLMSVLDRAAAEQRYRELLPHRRAAAARTMRSAGLVLRDDEASAIEIADFGLARYEQYGLAIHVYVNTDRCCAKELVLLPGQICPEHRHPSIDGELGKEETFRVRAGEVFLYVPGTGDRSAALRHVPSDKHAAHHTVNVVHLKPGDQYTLVPNTPHWFVGGPDGAVVSEFSTRSRDEADIFADAAIVRLPPV